ncbi:MAG TPA: hypothetical protein VFQ31_06885, partial [Methyloceanibacter sp.]|nr:hypothetical protein [Methyloceanibacter sp.]
MLPARQHKRSIGSGAPLEVLEALDMHALAFRRADRRRGCGLERGAFGDNNTINGGNTPGRGDDIQVVGSNNTVAATVDSSGSSVMGTGNTVDGTDAVAIGTGTT